MKIKKSDLNQNIHLSEGNTKSQETDDTIFLTWSLPSNITCPYATAECKKRCFAKKNENFENVRKSRNKNLAETYKDTFVSDMIKHFEYHLQSSKSQDKLIIVRIHTSGDFYNMEYFKKWVDITEHFKGDKRILFQTYTKSMPVIMDYMKWYENEYNCRYGIEDYEFFMQSINIHFIWSIWHDTNEDYTQLAQDMGLQTFTALPKYEINDAITNGSFLCNGSCGECKECYTGNSKKIVIPYH